MSLWSKIANAFRSSRLDSEIDEELKGHLQDAVEAGREPVEAGRAFGSLIRAREQSRDVRMIVWLDALRADVVFGWRQLIKRRTTSAAAILSLALAIGACTTAFRLIDALLLRPLPVSHADRLYAMILRGTGPDGTLRDSDSNEYPQFMAMRAAVKDDAELIAASWVDRSDLTYGSDQEMEKAYRQYVSGWMFSSFGLKPALGRLLTEADDLKPKAHAYAVLSYDYWSRRFGQDPNVVGRTFDLGADHFEIIGVGPKNFTGTEPGVFTDIFLPATMYAGVTHDDWSWIRTFVQLKPGGSVERAQQRMQAIWTVTQRERMKSFINWPPDRLKKFLGQKLLLERAGAGLSYTRQVYKVTLLTLAFVAGLVLLIACANVANLLTVQATARSREMALRVSIGAGRWRLIQLVLVESGLLALSATLIGSLFAWKAAPLIVAKINPSDNPARLILPADWRVVGFAMTLSIVVTFLFGLLPALRASAVKPSNALKGGDDRRMRRHLMHALIAAQVAFCFVVHFGATLFISTFDRLSNQPTGFSAQRLLTLETIAKKPQPTAYWYQVASHLRELSGIENVAIAGWPLLSGNGQNGFVSVNGGPPHGLLAYFLPVSPQWLKTMKIPLMDGRDIRPDDVTPGPNDVKPGDAIVNLAFAKEYFGGEDPVGKSFSRGVQQYKIIGLAADARYRNLREPLTATAYIPLRYTDPEMLGGATFLVKTASPNPLALASMIRREISNARPDFRVSNVRTQEDINQAQTVRERLLAVLALFFAGIALLLAGIGLYGVLDYSILQRRRELGIRIAVGAPAPHIVRQVTSDLFAMLLLGSVVGAGTGFLLQPTIKSLLYETKSLDFGALLLPFSVILLVASLAAVPAVRRALGIDAVAMLRSE